jgi:hypothetical protein
MPLGVILAITVSISMGLSLWILKRLEQNRKDSAKPTPEIEQEMTVSEFNTLIEDRESAARVPLENKIIELESRLSEKTQGAEGSEDRRNLTR